MRCQLCPTGSYNVEFWFQWQITTLEDLQLHSSKQLASWPRRMLFIHSPQLSLSQDLKTVKDIKQTSWFAEGVLAFLGEVFESVFFSAGRRWNETIFHEPELKGALEGLLLELPFSEFLWDQVAMRKVQGRRHMKPRLGGSWKDDLTWLILRMPYPRKVPSHKAHQEWSHM